MASTSDNNDIWRKWSKFFWAAIRKSIPSKLVPIRSSTPWVNKEIHKDIAKPELFYKRYKESNSEDWLSKFKTLSNKIVTNIRDAKSTFHL